MENPELYYHLRVDWVGESSTQSITLCGVTGKNIGSGMTLCPDCVHVDAALNVCGLGPGLLRELVDTLRVADPAALNAEIETLYAVGALLDMRDRELLH